MLIENQKIEVSWNNANKKHYIERGYIFTKIGDKFLVSTDDLPKGSNIKVAVKCDHCGTVKQQAFSDYLRCHKKHNIDLCRRCCNVSAQLTWSAKYGVSHPMQTKEVKDKSKASCLRKYGCENPMQNKDVKKKASDTLFERYGVYHPLQNDDIHNKANQACIDKYGCACVFKSEEIKEKIKESCLQKYGVENATQSSLIQEKIRQTNLDKYGVPNPMQNKDIFEKMIHTLYKHGNCPTSSQQFAVYNMLKNIYGNCELNYPCYRFSLDCMVNINGVLIDCEYDGQFWHQDEERDRHRDEFVLDNGYKVLRIKGNYDIPTEEQLIQAVDYLVECNHDYICIELDI